VELRNVRFAYEGAPTPALRDIDLTVEAGTTVALVGATGSGKSTLVQLLGRLYDVTEGSVLIDGADVREVDLESLRRSIAVVDDDPFLFSATVHDNIAYGKPDATRAEVERAAERAQAAGFVAELPDGYDTKVGERGLTLSGGQRQRLAIARALANEPTLLLADEPTGALDSEGGSEVIELMRRLHRGGQTIILVTHDPDVAAAAERVVRMRDGRIVDTEPAIGEDAVIGAR
jgi:ATP-binding cassette subfamily B protein